MTRSKMCYSVFISFLCLMATIYGINGMRVLIFTIDSREFSTNLNRHSHSHVSLAALLNYEFALKHNYTYRYFRHEIDLNKTINDFGVQVHTDKKDFSDEDVRENAAAYHPKFKQYRAEPWAKIPIIWYLCQRYENDFDYLMYLDSDAAFTVAKNYRSIENAMLDWEDNDMIVWGCKNISSASIIFFTNLPFGTQEACPGVMLFEPKKAKSLFKDWWDFYDEYLDFNPLHEESALRAMLSGYADKGGLHHILSKHNTVMVSEPQFVQDGNLERWCEEIGWICHLLSYHYKNNRHDEFKKMLHNISSDVQFLRERFKTHIQLIKENEMIFNIVDIAVDIMNDNQTITADECERKKKYNCNFSPNHS